MKCLVGAFSTERIMSKQGATYHTTISQMVQYLGMKLKTQRELEVLVNVYKVQLCSIPASTIFRRGDGTAPPIIPYRVKIH